MYFVYTMIPLFILGMCLSRIKPPRTEFRAKEGCVTVALSWIVMSIFGAIPFYISGYFPTFIDCFFADGIGIYDHRLDHTYQRGGRSQGTHILAELYPLDRRYGRARIRACHNAESQRLGHTTSEGGKPRPDSGKGAPENKGELQAALPDIFCYERGPGNTSSAYRTVSL